jgi:hypothetical protein
MFSLLSGLVLTEEARRASQAAYAGLVIYGLWPLVGLVAVIAYRYRRGDPEEWCVDDRELVVRASPSGSLVERVPFSHIESVRFGQGRFLTSAVGLWKRGQSQPKRLLIVDLPRMTILEIFEQVAERCESFRSEGTNEPTIETQVKLVPNWYGRGAEVACPQCGATRPIASAAQACRCGQRGWSAEWVVIPFAMMQTRDADGTLSRFALFRRPMPRATAWPRQRWWHFALPTLALVGLVVMVAFQPEPVIAGMIIPVVLVLGTQLFPYLTRPRALAVVTPDGVFGLDDRGQCVFDTPPTVHVGGLAISLETPTQLCVLWGRRSHVKALAELLAARRTEPSR